MKQRILLLAAAGLVYGSPSVFSVHDDLLAFPQYEVVFSDTYISETDADSRLAYAASKSTSETPPPDQDTTGELAQHEASSSSYPDTHDPNSPHATETYETMILHSKRYLCRIPRVSPPPQNATPRAPSTPPTDTDAQELARASSRGWELLQDMEGQCLYFLSGWWSYSFCYNSQIKQFHQLPPTAGTPPYPPQEDPSTPSYILGQFLDPNPQPPTPGHHNNALAESTSRGGRPPAGATSLRSKASKRYLSQHLSGGSTCDLTGRPRRVEVQFHCHPGAGDRIGWIKEVSTCAYVMVVYTARLCNEVAFLPPREKEAVAIVCGEVVGEGAVGAWEAGRAKAGGEGEEKRPVVGGIVVGGMRLVGTEGKRLAPPPPPPAPPPAGATARMATTTTPAREEGGEEEAEKAELVARSRGGGEVERVQRVSDEELKKMGFEPGEVRALLEEMQGVAEGNGWRVELVDVGGGARELRGVVEVEGGEDGEGDEGVDEGEGREGGEGEGREGSEEGYYGDEL